MRVIIAGSRSIRDYERVKKAIEASGWSEQITEVVCGMSRGVDMLGKKWAEENGVPVKCFYADWLQYGEIAGPIRNKGMASYADALILVSDGESKGSLNMLKQAIARCLPYYQEVEAVNV